MLRPDLLAFHIPSLQHLTMAMMGQQVVAAERGTIGPNSAYSLYSVQHQDNGCPILFRDVRVASTLTGLHATESISGPGVYCASRGQLEVSVIWMIGRREKCKVSEHGRGRHRLADFCCEAETHVRYSLGTPSLRLSRTQLRNCVVSKDCTWTLVLTIPPRCHNDSSRYFRSQAKTCQPLRNNRRRVRVMTWIWWYKWLVFEQHCKVRYSEMMLLLRETCHGEIRMTGLRAVISRFQRLQIHVLRVRSEKAGDDLMCCCRASKRFQHTIRRTRMDHHAAGIWLHVRLRTAQTVGLYHPQDG